MSKQITYTSLLCFTGTFVAHFKRKRTMEVKMERKGRGAGGELGVGEKSSSCNAWPPQQALQPYIAFLFIQTTSTSFTSLITLRIDSLNLTISLLFLGEDLVLFLYLLHHFHHILSICVFLLRNIRYIKCRFIICNIIEHKRIHLT